MSPHAPVFGSLPPLGRVEHTIRPPMQPGSLVYLQSYPPRAVRVAEQLLERVALENTTNRTVPYMMVIAPPEIPQALIAAKQITGAVRDLVASLRRK